MSDELTREELYEQAQELDIEGRSSMSKEELARAVARARKSSGGQQATVTTPREDQRRPGERETTGSGGEIPPSNAGDVTADQGSLGGTGGVTAAGLGDR